MAMWGSGERVAVDCDLYERPKKNWGKKGASVALHLSAEDFVACALRTGPMGLLGTPNAPIACAHLAEAFRYFLQAPAASGPRRLEALLPELYNLKDFYRTSLVGVAGAALAYAYMQGRGYEFVDHFENSVASTGAAPDFIFANAEAEFCIVEAKGTTQQMPAGLKAAKAEFKRQVHANRSELVYGLEPLAEGFLVSACFRDKPCRIRVLREEWPPGAPAPVAPAAYAAIIRSNYRHAIRLLDPARLFPQELGGPMSQALSDLGPPVTGPWSPDPGYFGVPLLLFNSGESWSAIHAHVPVWAADDYPAPLAPRFPVQTLHARVLDDAVFQARGELLRARWARTFADGVSIVAVASSRLGHPPAEIERVPRRSGPDQPRRFDSRRRR